MHNIILNTDIYLIRGICIWNRGINILNNILDANISIWK